MTSASTFSTDPTLDDESHLGTPSADYGPSISRLPERMPVSALEPVFLHGKPPSPGEVHVQFHQEALLQVQQHAQSNTETELGGALLGVAHRHEGQMFVEVMAAIPARSDERGPVHFTFTADAWQRIHEDKEALNSGYDIVGWFHTHPDLGVFFSADDVVVHSAAFVLPWHIGLVSDPLRHEMALFGWHQGQVEQISGYYELLEGLAAPVLPWRMVITSVWTDMESVLDEGHSALPSHVHLPQSDRPALLPWRRLIPLALAGVFVLGLLIALLLLEQRVNMLEQVTLGLAAQLVGPQEALGVANCPDGRLRILSPTGGQTVLAGQLLPIVGTTTLRPAGSFQIDLSPHGSGRWSNVGQTRRQNDVGLLARWDTSQSPPGVYDLRLTAVDDQGQPILYGLSGETTSGSDTAVCTITIQLVAGQGT